MRIGFIGGGNMAAALIKGITAVYGIKDVLVSEPRKVRRHYLKQHYIIRTTSSNKKVADSCNIIFLAVKPQDMEEVLNEIGPYVTEEKTVVSIAAGITLEYLSSRLRTKKIIRVMPNTPALVQEGLTVLSLNDCSSEGDVIAVKEILQSVGRVMMLPETQMNAVTALSGSGPAFFSFFIEAMMESAIKMGFGTGDASALVLQTARGTLKLLETGMTPRELIEKVTSPGGTTAAGLGVFEEKKLKNVVLSAIKKASARARELGESLQKTGKKGG